MAPSLLLALGLAATSAGAWAQLGGSSTEDDKGVLASLISRALSTPATRVSIGEIQGALSSDATISNIEIADRDGVWLRLDRARIVWRRLALLSRRLEIDRLEVGTLDVRRRAVPAEGQVPGENDPILPELPVKVEIKAFELRELKVGEPILGTEARVTATGNARLSNDTSEGLDLTFDARRLDRPGTLTARFGLVPQGQRMTLALKLDEPEGGIVARAASLPGLPPVRLDVEGQGMLDAFTSRLTFDAGPGIGATGSADLARQGPARRLGLDLQARIEGLLPPVAAPVFAGTTRLTGSASFGDDGTTTLSGINLTAAAARLDVGGRIGPDGVADLRVTAANLPNQGGRTAASGAEIRRLAFSGRVTGPLTGPTVDATLTTEDAQLAGGSLGRLEASLRAAPAGTAPGGATRLTLTADARATGVRPTDAALARALGETVTLTVRGTATTGGVIDADALTVATPTVTATYTGRLASDELRGRANLRAPSLAPFGRLAGLSLAGALETTAEIEGTPRANRYNATLDGRVTGAATGIAPVDGVFGGRIGLTGTLRVEPTGGYAFENLRLAGEHGSAVVNGRIAQDAGDLALTAEFPDLRRVDDRVTGRAALTARVTGGLQRPDVTATLTATEASALGRPIPRLALQVTGRDLTGALDATVTLDGVVDRRPARGTLRVRRPPQGGTALEGLDVTIGSVSAQGSVTLDPQNLASGRLAVSAANLDDLSPLLLTRAAGSLTADVTLDASGGGQGARIKAEADRVAVYGVTLAKASADLTLADIYRRPVVSGRVLVDEASAGGERLTRLRLEADGSPQASNVTLTANVRGFDIAGQARVVPGDRTRIEVSRLAATRGRDRLALAGPATLTVVPGGLDLRGVALGLGNGRLTLDGTVGSRLDLRAEARAVPLSVTDLVSPGLGLAGTLDGSARIGGTPAAPEGEYRTRIENLSAPQTRGLGLPRLDVTASGRLSGGRATIDATVSGGRAGSLRIAGSVPAGSAGALDVAVRGSLDAGAATSSLLGAAGRRFTGRVDVDARVAGSLAAPEASGTATLAGGTFTDATLGLRLTNIRARVVARGQEVVVESASATTGTAGGNLSASGRVRLDPAAGYPGDIRLVGRSANLARTGLLTAIANLDISVSGPLGTRPAVAGRVDILAADIAVPEQLGPGARPLPNTRHLNPTRTARARLALEGRTRGSGAGGRAPPPFDAALDLTLNAPGRIFVRGRGLNAELGGSLRLTGTLANPVPNGAFALRRGTFQVATTRLEFSRGRLTFTGEMTPELDFEASTNAGGAAIRVAVSGPANDPSFSFTSSPDLPQDEVLSRLLFNSPSGQLSAFQALALAQAAAQFSGGGGSDSFEALRRSLGLNSLDLGIGPGGGIGAAAQRALGDRLSVGVRAGASAGETGFGADLRITDELRVQGEVGVNGAAQVGIGAQFEW